jgi:hypothetical protein
MSAMQQGRTTSDRWPGGLPVCLAFAVALGIFAMPVVRVAHILGVEVAALVGQGGDGACGGDASSGGAAGSGHHHKSSCPICHLLSAPSCAMGIAGFAAPCLVFLPGRPWMLVRRFVPRIDWTAGEARAPPSPYTA